MKRTAVRDLVFDIAVNGLRADLNPTSNWSSMTEMAKFYNRYLRDIEDRLRKAAKAALDADAGRSALIEKLGRSLCEYCREKPALPPRSRSGLSFDNHLCLECYKQFSK